MYKVFFVFSLIMFLNSSCNEIVSTQSRENPVNKLSAKGQSNLEIPDELVKQLITDQNDNKNGYKLSDEELQALYQNLKLDLYDLNNDGISEFFLYIEHHFWCGAGSNCSYWVYQKNGDNYELLLEDKTLRVETTSTKGYRDLLSETKMGLCRDSENNVAFDLYITPYKFDGEKYKSEEHRNECRKFTPKLKP